jgi:hypothetical protein
MLGLGKKQIVVEDANFLYFGNGKRTEKRRLIGNYEIIKVIEKDGYTCRKEKPPAGVKFIYKKQQGKGKEKETLFCYTNTLNTDFINLILRDKIDSEKAILLKLTDNLGILFLKQNHIPLIGKNWEEIKKQAELILQGILYKEVDYNIVKKYIKQSDIVKYVIYGAIATVIAFTGYYAYDTFFYTPPPPPPPPPSQTIVMPQTTQQKPKEETINIPYGDTYKILSLIYSVKLPPYIFLKDINFSTKSINVASFFPLPTYVYRGSFYEKSVILNLKNVKIPIPIERIEQNRKKCYDFLNKYPILSNTETYTVYEISSPSMDIDKLNDMLQFLKNCPINLDGSITYQNLLRRGVDLKVYFYK